MNDTTDEHLPTSPALSVTIATDPTFDVANNNTNENLSASAALSVTIATDPTLDVANNINENLSASPALSVTIATTPDVANNNTIENLSASPALSVTIATDPTLDVAKNINENLSASPESPALSVKIATNPSLDVVMQDATSKTLASLDPQNDNNLPLWLAQMIAYLRGVSEDVAWQDLVTAFVAFEKCGPPHGVSKKFPSLLILTHDEQKLPTKLRPQEVTNWIKSKKKDVLPSFKLGTYGKAFKEWWMMMQPSWRMEGELLIRDVPEVETWQTLRKGGTSGIYIVVVGLSWWVKAQLAEQDTDAWTVVNDLSWVLQQMTESLAVLIPQKRAHNGDVDEEQTLRQKR